MKQCALILKILPHHNYFCTLFSSPVDNHDCDPTHWRNTKPNNWIMYSIIYLYSSHDFKFTNNGLIETVNLDRTEHLLIMINDFLKELSKIKNSYKIF